ncbi:MAG: 4-hydroxy-tetrahydrodipicolinate reductase [bacterium]
MKNKIRVIVSGASGRMGSEAIRAVSSEKDLLLVGAFDAMGAGRDAGEVAGIGANGVIISDSMASVLKESKADVVVDFTTAEGFENRATAILKAGCRLVTGTTGIEAGAIKRIARLAAQKKLGVLIAPNFAIGAVLMMQFAEKAAAYMPDCEIVELHHNRKLDAPSGTALATAEKIAAARRGLKVGADPTKTVKLAGARGGDSEGVHVHSIRLPGFLAHQEVIFGGPGQTLTIRHDTISRECFMPGVTLAARRIITRDKLVIGLENLL